MAEISKKHQDRLANIKKCVEESYEFFKPNYDRFNEFRRMVFDTSLTDNDVSVLQTLKKPIVEFNILEPYISRLRGEFAQQQPSIVVSAEDGEMADPRVIEVVEGYLRHILHEANNNSLEYNVYTDLLSGGFSVIKVYTDYSNKMSFKQNIYWKRVFDPTLVGFDPLAQLDDKSDGQYCFEVYPKSKKEFGEEYPNVNTDNFKFSNDVGAFSWSYRGNNNEKILLICDFYQKKKKRVKIVEMVDGKVLTKDEYKKFLMQWEQEGYLAMPPAIRNERYTEIEYIHRYRIVENEVLEVCETDYRSLPYIFVDGNSITIRQGVNGAMEQMCRPYVYHAKGAQKLKNFSGQTLANELENMIQHKWKVAKESIPPAYKEAYINPQIASTIVYNAFKNDDPNIPLPPPQEIARIPIPPEVSNTFSLSDTLTQNILGSFDTSARQMTSGNLSGVAIIESATLTNAAAMPYVMGFLKGLNSACNATLQLIPYYIVTPRTIPVVGIDGKPQYVRVNDKQTVSLKYDENVLQVKVEPGVNFAVQKSRALNQIISLMQASPLFAQFMNTEGLGILLDNIEMRGADQLKIMAEQWMQKIQQQQAQQAQQPDPQQIRLQLEQQKLAQKQQSDQVDAQLKAAQLAIDKTKILNETQQNSLNNYVQLQKAEAEKMSKAVDLAIKTADMKHKHSLDIHKAFRSNDNGER